MGRGKKNTWEKAAKETGGRDEEAGRKRNIGRGHFKSLHPRHVQEKKRIEASGSTTGTLTRSKFEEEKGRQGR